MIIKICEEMRQVRIESDYMNYRTLVNILRDYFNSDLLNAIYIHCSTAITPEYMTIIEKIRILNKWINSEISHVKELLETNLKNKNYKNFKMLSQSDIVLRWMRNRVEELESGYAI